VWHAGRCPGTRRCCWGITALVISAGFAGGLDDKSRKGDIVMGQRGRWTRRRRLTIAQNRSAAAAARGPLADRDRVVTQAAEKRKLAQAHQALAVDMETLAVAQVCQEEKVRFWPIARSATPWIKELPRDVDRR